MQHRIFLAPLRPGVAWAEAHAHWCSHHEAIMLDIPGLVGYVQDRPCREWWIHLPYLACSETWFADREAERAAYASDWYQQRIAVDEARMLGRDDAWNSPVVDVDTVRAGPTGRFRALAFGSSPERLDSVLIDGRVETLRLLRPPPGGGESSILSVWTDDADLARHAALRLGGLAFVAEPAASLSPPAPPWSS
ncbi:MAG TPA: EthD domain-containing protein [Solirubrobacteraceae bacterium]|nr:EthD domain-containing protein [Solirubrobacteraceae bacterium]